MVPGNLQLVKFTNMNTMNTAKRSADLTESGTSYLLIVVDRATLVALIDVLATVRADARMGRHRRRAAGALQHLRRSVKVLIEGRELDFQITRRNGQRQVYFHLRLALRQRKLFGLLNQIIHLDYKSFNDDNQTVIVKNLVPDSGPILELDGGLNGSVVVVDDDGAHHLSSLDIGDAQREAVDHVAADQLDNLRRRREAHVRLQCRVLHRGKRHLIGTKATVLIRKPELQ